MLKNISIWLIICIIPAFILPGCALFEWLLPNPDRNWTIMIWMNGDNNLEPNGIEDFDEIEYGLNLIKKNDVKFNKKLSIIVQFDRISGYDSGAYGDTGDWTTTRRYLMKPDGDNPSEGFKSELLSDLGEVNMGDAANLKDFITFCKATYPANNYALILWNHGLGVKSITPQKKYTTKAVSIDATSGGDSLYIGEITNVLTDAEDVNLLGFDACLMGMAEIAYEYRPGVNKFGAEYMVAAPSEEQIDGWEYEKVLNRLKKTGTDNEGDQIYNISDLTPQQLAGIIIKEYGDAFNVKTSSESLTAINLSKIQNVKTSMDALSVAIRNNQADAEAIRGSNTSTTTLEYFKEDESYFWTYVPNFDIYDFAERIKNGTSFSTDAKNAANTLMVAVDAAVDASYGGTHYNSQPYNGTDFLEGRHGLAFFFPNGDLHYSNQWWYTNEDARNWNGNTDGYGFLDFCNSNTNGTVETWRELLEYWYDSGNDTPGSY